MNPELINTISAIAQVVLALAALTLSGVIYFASKRMARLECDRAIREWWNTLDQVALSSDEMLTIADEFMDPESSNQSVKQRRRKWFAFMVLNALASSYVAAKLGLTRSYEDTLGIVRHHLRRLLLDPDIFRLSQSGYETDFAALCGQVREELVSEK